MLRTNNWPRGELRSYDVHEVSPSQLQPLARRRACTRTHARTHAHYAHTHARTHTRAPRTHTHARTRIVATPHHSLTPSSYCFLLLQLTLMEDPPSDHLSPLATSPPLPLTFPPTPPRPPRHPYRFIPLLSEPTNLLSPSPLSSARRSFASGTLPASTNPLCTSVVSRSRRPSWTGTPYLSSFLSIHLSPPLRRP